MFSVHHRRHKSRGHGFRVGRPTCAADDPGGRRQRAMGTGIISYINHFSVKTVTT